MFGRSACSGRERDIEKGLVGQLVTEERERQRGREK